MRRLSGPFIIVATAAVLLFSLTSAQAVSFEFPFGRFTSSAPVDYSDQFLLTVTDEGVGSGQVKFTISSSPGSVGEITQIYFYDGALRSGVSPLIQNSPPDVEFLSPASSPDVPGGGNVGLKTSASPPNPPPGAWFSISRFTPGPDRPNPGVNAGESVSVVFTLPNGNTIQGVVDDMNRWIDLSLADKKTINWNITQSDYLAVALHVQELPDGMGGTTSDSFATVPLPASALLLGSGLLGLGLLGRQRRKKA